MGLGMLLNPVFYKKILEDFTENESIGYLGALATFIIGFFLITLRSGVEGNVATMITVFGWIALIKGLLMITLPQYCLKFIKFFSKRQQFILCGATIILLLGIVLMYIGVMML